MTDASGAPSTGLPSLDAVLTGLRPGDNVVWQVDAIDEYATFVAPFWARARAERRRLVYFRFARHAPLVAADAGATVHQLSPEVGFETFTTEIHGVIEQAGRGAFYVFDCLSDLVADWYSDLMLGNFFMVTCPYLYELDTITYFGLVRDHHSVDAVAAIRDTTQLLLDVFRDGETLYVHPLKVDQRHSSTMYLPHVYEAGTLRPLTESAVVGDVLGRMSSRRVDVATRRLDAWDRRILQLRDELTASGAADAASDERLTSLLRMMVTRDERPMSLASRYLELSDVLAIRRRILGTGLVGGKAVGMLLARAILGRTDRRWRERLEPHDSFYIGSDVFYTYLVRNGCWRVRRQQRHRTAFLEGAAEARQRILDGTFPPAICEQFVAMLEYFGQSPIIVRSSSLLEDSFGNAFTGKYDSVFCPNQGDPDDRLHAFLTAVRTVYASTMSEAALRYRASRGLLESDEQMAVLIQRVSGAVYRDLFYPQIAGVGLSYNPYVWSEYIDPEAGMLRLVFGLGTRAVDRADDDYTRVVALNAPLRRPETTFDEVTEYAQHRVDVLDLEANCFRTLNGNEVLRRSPGVPVELFATPRGAAGERASRPPAWVLTFERLLSRTPFIEDMRALLQTLRQAYAYPVDVEYTANFLADGRYRINLVQCRPLQVKEGGAIVAAPPGLAPADIVLEARGTVVGQSSFAPVHRLIYVVPDAYARLPITDRYAVARLIGQLTHLERDPARPRRLMLLGPGRWGTSTPSLGVPVRFAEIDTVSVLCEIVSMGEGVVPSVSLGTHFFNDLVESNMLYLAVYPGRSGHLLNAEFFAQRDNRLAALVPDASRWAPVVCVLDVPADAHDRTLYLHADCLTQRAVCYLAPAAAP